MTTPIQLPLAKGLLKNATTGDYDAQIPVNMLATVGEVLNAAGYMRSFPGTVKFKDVNGLSRGGEFNTFNNVVYRVIGEKVYRDNEPYADIANAGRCSFAHSETSQGICANGSFKMYRYDGAIKTLSNWPADNTEGYPSDYELGTPSDITRNRSRYAWVKQGTNTFGITALDDESHPDPYNPFYTAEIYPDILIGIGMWRDFIVAFGSASIEFFNLTGATDTTSARYITQPSLAVNIGIAGIHAKCLYGGSYAFVSNRSAGYAGIYTLGAGSYTKISTIAIDKILDSYSDADLSNSISESISFQMHDLLIIHLVRHTLVYDANGTSNGPQWCMIKTGREDSVYLGIDFFKEDEGITVANKVNYYLGKLDYTTSSQYDVQTEHILYTPLAKLDKAKLFDFELESATGAAQYATAMFISATTDGVIWGMEKSFTYDKPFRYDTRVLWRRIGYVRKNIGFRIRIVTKSPVTLSGLTMRAE